jgi:signal peptidase II
VFLRLPDLASAPIVVVKGFIEVVHSENRGGVFGLGQGSPLWLIFVFAAGGLVIWFAHRKGNERLLLQIALGLILAGAVGNGHDRIVFGFVRDFINVYYWPNVSPWPAFNIADSGICVGAAYVAVHAFFFAPRPENAKGSRKP